MIFSLKKSGKKSSVTPESDRIWSIPEQTRVYAIGDVHGRADLLENLFARIDADMKARPLARMIEVLLGDYIDRGPDSKKVLDLLVERLLIRGGHTICLKGNHEQFLLDLLETGEGMESWIAFGGLEALVSYGINPGKPSQRDFAEMTRQLKLAVPRMHMIFLNGIRTSLELGDYIFVHAGIRPGLPLSAQDPDDLMGIREPFLSSRDHFEKRIIHGHTPVKEVEFWPHRINIDTGAYITNRLSCLVLEGTQARLLEDIT